MKYINSKLYIDRSRNNTIVGFDNKKSVYDPQEDCLFIYLINNILLF